MEREVPAVRTSRSNSTILWWVLGGLAAAAFLLPQVSAIVNPAKWDEYIVVFDAQRLLNGQVPYRDFFNFIPPGAFYALAGAFSLLGKGSITAARYASLLSVLGGWAFLFGALLRAGWSRGRALVLSLVFPVCLYPFWAVVSHHWLAALCAMAFLWAAAGAAPAFPPGRAFVLGLIAGLAAIFLQTDGIYLGILGGLLLLVNRDVAGALKRVAAFAAGWIVPVAGAFLPLVFLGAGPDIVRDILLWPSRNYSHAGNDNARFPFEDLPTRLHAMWNPLPGPHGPWQWVPFAAAGTVLYACVLVAFLGMLALALAALVKILRERKLTSPFLTAACLVTFLGLGLFLRGRPDWLHTIFLSAFLLALWFVTIGLTGFGGDRLKRVIVVFFIVTLAAGALYQDRRAWFHVPTLGELANADAPVEDSAVNRFLHDPANLPPGSTVAAFPEGGEVYLYGVPPAVGYTFFTPLSWDYNTMKDHEIVARQIVKNRPLWILVTPDLERDYLDRTSPVGRLMRKDYERSGTVGNAVLYRRKGYQWRQ